MMAEEKIDGLSLGISSVADGNMHFRYGERDSVIFARKQFLASAGLPSSYVAMEPAHSDAIAEVGSGDIGRGADSLASALNVDALITREPQVLLALFVADCIPMIFFEPDASILALVHVGWRGSALKLAAKTVGKISSLGGSPAAVIAYLGPSIKQQSYFFDGLEQAGDPEWQDFIRKENGNLHLDLAGFNKRLLLESGLSERNIEISPIDTARDARYFSHFRSKQSSDPEGRFGVFVMMK